MLRTTNSDLLWRIAELKAETVKQETHNFAVKKAEEYLADCKAMAKGYTEVIGHQGVKKVRTIAAKYRESQI